MDKKSGLTRRQLMLLLWAAMLAPLVRQSPAGGLPAAGRAVWLSALLTLPAAAVPAFFLSALLGRRRPGEGPDLLVCRLLGQRPGRALGLALGLWLCFCAGFTLRAGADRMVAAVYPESPAGLFAALMLALCLPAALGSRRALGRLAELCAPLLLALFVAVLALALPKVDPSSLRPDNTELSGAPLGAVPLLGTIAAGAFFALLWGGGESKTPFWLFFLPLVGLSLTALGLSAVVTGFFGPALAGEMSYSFFVLLRNLELPHLLERGEALVAAAWVISDYLLTASQLTMASLCLNFALRGPGIERKPTSVWLAAALAALGAVLCAPDAFALQRLGRGLIPLVDLAAGFFLPPLILAAGKLREKISGRP